MSKTPSYYVLWPKGSGRKPQKLTSDYSGGRKFEAQELPEPLELGPDKISDFKGGKELQRHVGRNIRIAAVMGKKLHISDTGQSVMLSENLDQDSAFGQQEIRYLDRVCAHLDQARRKDVRQEFTKLGLDPFLLDHRTLSNVRTALDQDTPQKVLEGVASMRTREATTLNVMLKLFRNELTSGLKMATDFHDRMVRSTEMVLDPDMPFARIRHAFALKSHELDERFELIDETAARPVRNNSKARQAAEEVMEHYAAIHKFTDPSKDRLYDRLKPGLTHPDPDVRSYMAASVVFTKIGRAAPDLFDLLKDENKVVVKSSVAALGEIGHPKAAGPIGKIMRASGDPEVREICIASLGSIGTRMARGILKRWEPYETDPTCSDDIKLWRKREP